MLWRPRGIRTGKDECDKYLAVAISVEDVNNALHQWILLQFRQRHELVNRQGSRVIQIQFPEPLAEASDLVSVNCHIWRVFRYKFTVKYTMGYPHKASTNSCG